MANQRYWLMKSEPDVYSIDNLERDEKTSWEGVRNYQARNYMRDQIKIGDLILFYHSNADPSGVAGVAQISREAYADHLSWDRKSKYFDPKSSPANPIWFMIDVSFVEKFPHFVSLDELRAEKFLKDMLVLKKGMRLSIQPVDSKHFNWVRKMGYCSA